MRRAGAVLALGTAAALPLIGEFAALVGTLAVIFSLVALGYVVLTGWAGDVSLGQVVPYGLGAYAVFFLSETLGLPVVLALPLAALIVGPFIVAVGIPALRLRGLDLAIGTFALALVFQLVVFKNLGRLLAGDVEGLTDFSSSVVRVARPVIGPLSFESNRAFYVLALVSGLALLTAVASLGRSPAGRALRAVRDDPIRAEVTGVPVAAYRLGAFVLAGMITAFAGGLAACLRQAITADTFTIFESLNFLAMAIIGGVASVRGAVLGGAFGALLPELARLGPFRFLQGRLILVYGIALVALLAFRPGGLASLLGLDRRPAPSLPSAPQRPPPRPPARKRRSLLRTLDVSVDYGGVRAVDSVSMRVADGECVALVGPNGAGKSTFFDVVSGLLAPTTGRVFFDGTDVSLWAPHRRAAAGMARTFQAVRVFPTLSVAENLVAAATLAEGVAPEAVAADLLDRFALGPEAQAMPSSLPFGTLRNLEVAMALAGRPRLLLLDEPAAGMDTADAERLCATLQTLREEWGLSLLLVEHDMRVVGRLAERVVVLDRGQVIAEGAPSAIAADPVVIASYLGTTAGELAQREAARA